MRGAGLQSETIKAEAVSKIKLATAFALIFKIDPFHAVRHAGQYFIRDRT